MQVGDLVRVHKSAVLAQPGEHLVGIIVDIQSYEDGSSWDICDILIGKNIYPVLAVELEVINGVVIRGQSEKDICHPHPKRSEVAFQG